jgi:hypothetical protein
MVVVLTAPSVTFSTTSSVAFDFLVLSLSGGPLLLTKAELSCTLDQSCVGTPKLANFVLHPFVFAPNFLFGSGTAAN